MAYYYHIWTIGCQMNQADSEQLSADLERLGYQPTQQIDNADLIVLNTCVVRQSAENRVLSKLDSLKELKRLSPNAVIALAGCMVDSDKDRLRHRFPHVDLFLKPGQFNELLNLVKTRTSDTSKSFVSARLSTTAFVTIIEGCDNLCSYCIVPYRRGREKSRSIAEVRCQIESLVERGVKEVTLLGQNVDSYGHDLPDKPSLADLLQELNSVEGLARIRFLTSHPKDMSQKLVQTVASLKKVCEHISLPVQSGDDEILEAMGRGYTVQYYRELVERIRLAIPNVALVTDVIIGFPGETEAQFQHTIQLLSDVRFDTVHVAAYSPRPDTIAARKFKDDIPSSEKRRRLQEVEKLQSNIASEINARLLGHDIEVLVEGKKKGKWYGRTKTDKLVFFEDEADWLGQLVNIEVKKTSPWSLQGSLKPRKPKS
ncbi:MAG TPA: tRNA (N6-isopentenyl adenosine(37)-C2)-methylthiotransferase MiaB [Dehalococcoidia bacterium]|nr:tRNA (N6-isopentenyl adenosine(37)-C2)-methylthiotransferase MiaB [Dehalococcoidia bacterium]